MRSSTWYQRTRLLIFAVVGGLLAATAFGEDSTIVTLEREVFTGNLAGISERGEVHLDSRQQPLSLGDIRQIAGPADAKSPQELKPAPLLVRLSNGSRMLSAEFTLADEQCKFQLLDGQQVTCPLDSVRAVMFPKTRDVDQQRSDGNLFQRTADNPRRDADLLLVRSAGEETRSLDVLVESTDNRVVVFSRNESRQTISRDRLAGLVLANLEPAARHDAPYLIHAADGSQILAQKLSLADGTLSVQLEKNTRLTVPWHNVVRIQVRSDRIEFISNLEPIDASHTPILAPESRWQADRAIAGGPLTLAGVEYQKGISCRSGTRLTFDINRGFQTLTAIVGIDDRARPQGNCVYIVMGDDEELYRERVRGTDAPKRLRVDVSDMSKLTLLVQHADDLDLADHANWCDAYLIRAAE